MYDQAPLVAGARAPHRPSDTDLQKVVAALLPSSMEDMEKVNSCNISSFDSKLQELLDHVNNPARKTEHSVSSLMGHIFLILHSRIELQTAALRAQVTQLQQEISSLRAQNQAIQQDRTKECKEAQAGQINGAVIQEKNSRSSDHDEDPSKGAVLQGTFPRSQLASSGTVSNLISEGRHQALPTVHSLSSGVPLSRVTHRSILDHHSEPSEQVEFPQQGNRSHLHTYSGARSFEPPLPHEVHAPCRSQLRFTRSPSPPSWRTFRHPLPSEPPASRSWRPRYAHTPSSSQRGDFESLSSDEELTSLRLDPHSTRTAFPQHRKSHRPPHYGDLSDYETSADSDGPRSHCHRGLRTRQLESLARDIERFDPSSRNANVDDYLREVERCLVDLPDASTRERLKLIWKTTARSVHVFIESLPDSIRDCYSALCKALREEYSLYTDEISATLHALAIMQKKHESPQEYYWRLRSTYFQGRSAPGLEESGFFKSLFLHNLHESIRFKVTMHCREHGYTMQETRRYAQLAWQTRMRPTRLHEGDEMPRDKRRARRGRRRRRQSHRQALQQNQEGGDQTPPQTQGRPNWQTTPVPNGKVQFKQNSKRWDHNNNWKHTASMTPRGQVSGQDLEHIIRTCISETIKRISMSNCPEGPPDSAEEPGPSPHWHD